MPCRLNRLFCLLWSDLWLLWPRIKTLKTHARSLGFWLQGDIEWIFKWAFIFQTPSSSGHKTMDAQSWRSKKSWDILGSRLLRSRLYLVIAALRAARVRIPAGANFEGLQFCSPLAYRAKKYFFWKIWSIFIMVKREQTFCSTFKACYTKSKYPEIIS